MNTNTEEWISGYMDFDKKWGEEVWNDENRCFFSGDNFLGISKASTLIN
jgi:hypothetical protein